MSYKDFEVYAAISLGNQEQFNNLCNKLRQYAASLGISLFSDRTARIDAIDSAMDKAKDWLGSGMVESVNYPWKYVRRIIANAMFDAAKTRKIEGLALDSKLHDGLTVQQIMALHDEGFASLVDEYDRNEEAGSGWRMFKIIDEDKANQEDDGKYHRHRWIVGLENLSKYQMWWNVGQWVDKFEGEYKAALESWNKKDLEIKAQVQIMHSQEKLRSKFDLICALLESIPGISEKKVVQRSIWGYKGVQIANELGVSEPYVSKTINKWSEMWGWEDASTYEARLILLAYYLAKQYDLTLHIVDKGKMTNPSAEIQKLVEEYVALSKIPRQDDWDPLYEKEDAIARQIRDGYFQLATTPKLNDEGIYKKVIKARQTKVYFNDLDSFEQGDLINLCHWFWSIWYPHRLTFKIWWDKYWRQYDKWYYTY
jgi:hypothetical protein